MRLSFKFVLFFSLFTLMFFIARSPLGAFYYDTQLLLSDLGGIAYLYSAVGMVFAIIAAFVVFLGSERWNRLNDAVREEIASLRMLWLWTGHLPEDIKTKFQTGIKEYLDALIDSDLAYAEAVEKIFGSFSDDLYRLSQSAPILLSDTFRLISDLQKYRTERLHYVLQDTPGVLRHTLDFANILFVAFSFFIGVKNIWLDYLFVGGIALLGYAIHLVINDLNHPLQQGGWHLTAKGYKNLLEEFRQRSTL